MSAGGWEYKCLPLPAATLGGDETRVLTVVPLLGGEVRELIFPTECGERFHVGPLTCDGRNMLGRRTRRGVLFLSSQFSRGSRLCVTLTNLRARETPVYGFAFGCNVRTLSRAELVSEIEAIGRRLTLRLTDEQVREFKRQLGALEAMLKAT